MWNWGEVSSPFFKSISNANGEHVVVSGASTMEFMHDVEYTPIKDNLHGLIILVSKSVRGYSDVEQGLDKGGSMNNILSLDNWNECSEKFDGVCSSVFDIKPLRRGIPVSRCSFNDASSSKLKRSCDGSNRACMWSIMGLGEPNHAECSIHDLHIENINRILLRTPEHIVQDCSDLGITFCEKEEDIMFLVVCILKRELICSIARSIISDEDFILKC